MLFVSVTRGQTNIKPIQMLRDRNRHREVRFICASLLVRNRNNIITVHVNVSSSEKFYELKWIY